jgi:hypothetical protein
MIAVMLCACDVQQHDDDGVAPDCENDPVVTYDTFGRGFLAAYCNGCHGSHVVDRKGAPPATLLDDRDTVAMLGDRILARTMPADGSAPTMPPAGGITDDDRERLQVWLTCWPD